MSPKSEHHDGRRTLEIYRLVRSQWVVAATHARADTVGPEPFATIAIDLDRWWLPE
jgi:hypothetical protein